MHVYLIKTYGYQETISIGKWDNPSYVVLFK